MLVSYICPRCKTPAASEPGGLRCSACARLYPVRQGIPCFLDAEDSFNEGDTRQMNEDNWTSSARLRERIRQSRLLSLANLLRIKFSISGRRDRVFYDEMRGGPPDRLILDLGCGGGRHYFTEYGRVVGLDPVLELLRISQRLYAEVCQGSAAALPFASGSFDYVVSSDVLGHIPFEIKDAVFSEIYRVLKKGGRTVHLIETDSTNWWFRFAHRRPALFKKQFVDTPGHISLEMPSLLRARFLKHGFKELRFGGTSTSVPECGALSGILTAEFTRDSAGMRLLTGLDGLLARNFAVREAMNFLLEPLARVNDAFRSIDDGGGALVVFEK